MKNFKRIRAIRTLILGVSLSKRVLLFLGLGFGILILTASAYFLIFKPKSVSPPKPQPTASIPIKLDPTKEKTHLSKVADTKDAYWQRMFELWWEMVEPQKGKFNFNELDQQIKEFNQSEIYLVVTIKPFASWDQNTCHQEEKYEAETHLPEKRETKVKVGKPCDMNAYANFLEKVVERYDGDGIDDMPGLLIPVKFWEIMNEPEMQGGVAGGMGEELKFFVGTPKDYLEILKTSSYAIKKADPDAKVVQGGMAGMQKNFLDFWEPIIAQGGGNYFDIANMHTISTDSRREDLFVIKFKKFLKQFGLEEKPIWLTEVQFGKLAQKPEDLKSFEILLAKASVFALSKGADKLFYIDNWLTFWDGQPLLPEKEKKGLGPQIDPEELKSSTHRVYLNLVEKINEFEKIETILEEYEENPADSDGATSKIGQYKFISGSKAIYVLWGKAELPAEISGPIRVTDIYGNAKEMEVENLNLTEEPVFVEII